MKDHIQNSDEFRDPHDPHDPQNPIDPLEERLRRLRPKPVSDRLRSRIGADLAQLKPSTLTPPKEADPPAPLVMPRSGRMWWGLAAGIIAAVTVGWFAAINHSINQSSTPVARSPDVPGTGTGHGTDEMANRGTSPGPTNPYTTSGIAPTLINYTRAAGIDDAALDRLLDKDATRILQPQTPQKNTEKPLVF